jgi:hypothetical protein
MPMDNTPHPTQIKINGVYHLLKVDINKEGKKIIKPVPESEVYEKKNILKSKR